MCLSLYRFVTPSHKSALSQVWLQMSVVLSIIFKYLSCIFATLQLYPFGKWCVPSFHWLNSLHPRILHVCTKFVWNISPEIDDVFSLFRRDHRLVEGVVLHLNKFYPFIQGCFLLSLAEIGPFLLRRFLNNVYAFLVFCYYLENSVAFQLNRLEFPSSF